MNTNEIFNLPSVQTVIQGGMAVDDRGSLSFVNDLNFEQYDIKRFYLIKNHSSNFIRAWHGHLHESKIIGVIKGSAIISSFKFDNVDFEKYTKSQLNVEKEQQEALSNRIVLSEYNSKFVYIPKGYANGFMNLTLDTILIVFSSSTIEESKNDDYRIPYNIFETIFKIEPR